MNIFKKILQYIKPSISIPEKEEPNKSLNQVKKFDDVWIKIDNKIYEGWIYERQENVIKIIYNVAPTKFLETSFKIERPYNRESLEQDNKTLFITKRAANQ